MHQPLYSPNPQPDTKWPHLPMCNGFNIGLDTQTACKAFGTGDLGVIFGRGEETMIFWCSALVIVNIVRHVGERVAWDENPCLK